MDIDVDKGLEEAARQLGGQLGKDRRYGWNKKSVGGKITFPDGRQYWLRIQFTAKDSMNPRLWNGDITAPTDLRIKRPQIVKVLDWEEGKVCWRALLMTYIEEQVCSLTPELTRVPQLTSDWYKELRSSVEILSQTETDRVCVRQDLINRRVRERYGGQIDTQITKWIACHGDLHWANLTAPKFYLLDWEGWGQGPQGLDIAFLLAYSLLQQDVFYQIQTAFHDWLSTRDGIISTLFVCSELLHMIDVHHDHPTLRGPLENFGRRVSEQINVQHHHA